MAVPFKKSHELEYGMQKCTVDPQTNVVLDAKCLFCVHFGKEGSNSRKRKATANVKYFKAPFRVQYYKSHLKQHATKWEEYQTLSDEEKRNYFISQNEPYVSTLNAHFENYDRKEMEFVLDARIVDGIIDELMYDPEDCENVSKQRALSIFIPIENTTTYKVKVKNYRQFLLIQKFIACGASFRLAKRMMDSTKEVTNLGYLAGVNMLKVIQCVRTVVSLSLQYCSELMMQAWAYSIALDGSNKGTSAYLDVRLRIFSSQDIHNLHLLAIPMFDRHTGEYMFNITAKLFQALDPNWKDKIIGVTSDGAANMTGNQRGLATRLEQVALPGFHRVWCALHQLDLVVQKAVLNFFNDDFYSTLTGIIGYLRRQQNLIEEMGAKCPKVGGTRWLSLGKVSKWILHNRVRIMQYFDARKPACEPNGQWWIHLAVCDGIMNEVNTTFVSGQGLSTLVSQQVADLEKLVRILIAQIGARYPLLDLSSDDDNSIVIGEFVVKRSDVESMVKDCGLYFEGVYNELTVDAKNSTFKDVATFVLSLINEIKEIKSQATVDGTQVLPPVLPHQLIRIRSHQFNVFVHEQSLRYLKHRTDVQHQMIQEEHRSLCRAYQSEQVLMDQLDQSDDKVSFLVGWRPLEGRFVHLKEFCAGLATVFPGTATVESDFSIINFEKNIYRSALTDLSLEGILHCKQFPLVTKLHDSLK